MVECILSDNIVDEMLWNLGYYPDTWRKMNEYNYRQYEEGKIFYYMDSENFNKIHRVEPWEGQRP